jgi:chromosome segregation ATPase
MSDSLLLTIGGIIGGVVTGLFQFFIAKLSAKSRQDRAADLIQTHLKINEITADQLEESINQVWKLVSENIEMKRELSEFKAKRLERDEQFEAMRSHISALQEQINKDASERNDLRNKLSQFEVRNRSLWQYLIALLEQMKRHSIVPLDPPKELESDPEIMKIIQEIKEAK